ncbi:4-(cytidine 5'-diphospho)-2-C-methyl-D-erythritol kinase [Roseibium sp. RKSG952]|nr:4-(cytidine 5'-diphospho)-2-C-methyl-D-erythritol kinase [Roseibium sp. RKSG952]
MFPAGPLSQEARAKVNLALHVTGRRADGYHLLDSLVVFPAISDRLTAHACDHVSLTVTGPFAPALDANDPGNLVLKACHAFAREAGISSYGMRFTLDKHLPVASGIGGGSADAAASLRLFQEIAGKALDTCDLNRLALSLGADVPVCLASRSARMRGIGDVLDQAPAMPSADIVLVNPGVGVPTPAVFKAMTSRDNAGLPDLPGSFADLNALVAYLGTTRNDMQAVAEALCPAIPEVIAALVSHPATQLARMSGSGATCFALTETGRGEAICQDLRRSRPGWWIASGPLS